MSGQAQGGDASVGGHMLDPRARTMWTLVGAGVGVVLGIALTVGLGFLDPVLVGVGLGGLVVLALAGAVYARLLWGRWRWQQDTEALALRHGLVIQRASFIPYRRIQQIDIERGPLERLFGLTQLVLHTASATTDATIPGLAVDQAEALRSHLLEQAGVDDAV